MRTNQSRAKSRYRNPYGIVVCDDNADADLQRQDPPRTRMTHPYSYDPFTIWGKAEPDPCCNGSDYTDRLEEWDYKKFHEIAKETYVGGARPFNSQDCRGDLIEKFLRRYHNAPDLKLLRVIEYCNQSSGYPVWRLNYVTPSKDGH